MVDQVDNLKKKKKKKKNKEKEDGEKVKSNYFIEFIFTFLPTLQRLFIKRGG